MKRKGRVFSYRAYGLGIHSVLPLPELEGQEGAADVVVHLGQVDRSRLEVVDEYHAFWATPDEAGHFFRDAGAFLVRNGREIIIDPAPEADERALRLALLGPALALVLLQRGRLVLHASAIAVTGSAVAFLGRNGWGKSTMAAALYTRGYDMVTVERGRRGDRLPHPEFKRRYQAMPRLKKAELIEGMENAPLGS